MLALGGGYEVPLRCCMGITLKSSQKSLGARMQCVIALQICNMGENSRSGWGISRIVKDGLWEIYDGPSRAC